MDTPLLKTKFYIPAVRPELVPRPRLLERLNAWLGHKLTLVSASAGFGKTTLVADWLHRLEDASASGRPGEVSACAWLSLDEDDNDPVRFLTYLVAALEAVQPGVGEGALSLLQPSRHSLLKAALAELINGLSALPGRLVLALDDYHVIEKQQIHDLLSFLLDHLPPRMHLVIISRTDPLLPLARLRGRGQMSEIRSADLRFTPAEATTFLNQAMGLNLTADYIAALETRTEGWIAGLQLAALSMKGRNDLDGFIAAFTGSQRYVLDYLMEEVLQRQDEAVQSFLLRTSILDRLSGPLCDSVLEEWPDGGGGQTMLEWLDRANLFIVPLDDRQYWYRYHYLFAEFLRARLLRLYPELVPELHLRASGWYERNGLSAEAIDYALAANDFERAANLIERAVEPTLMRSEIVTFLNWVEKLPDSVMHRRPRLCVYQAGMQLMNARSLKFIEARLQEAEEADTDGTVTGAVTAIRALLALWQGDLRRSAELHSRAFELLPEGDLFLRSFVGGLLSLNYFSSSDVVAARREMEESTRIGQEAGNLFIVVVAKCHQAELSMMIEGRLHEAQEIYSRALEMSTDRRGVRSPAAGFALMGLGSLLLEWNDLDNAKRYTLEGMELGKGLGEAMDLQGQLTLALESLARGDTTGVMDVLQKSRQLAERFDVVTNLADVFLGIYRAWIMALMGNVEEAGRWAEERGLDKAVSSGRLAEDTGGAFSLYQALEYITLAQVYVAQKRFGPALEVLRAVLQIAEAGGWNKFVIQGLTLQAMALHGQGNTFQAMTSLTRALSLAEPEGFVRVFVDEGRVLAELLLALLHRGSLPEHLRAYALRLLSAFGIEGYGPQVADRLPPQPGLFEPLSERELEVLKLLTAGLSNERIADSLTISVGTVKRHISNIYSKLGVHSRTQATARARDLHLL